MRSLITGNRGLGWVQTTAAAMLAASAGAAAGSRVGLVTVIALAGGLGIFVYARGPLRSTFQARSIAVYYLLGLWFFAVGSVNYLFLPQGDSRTYLTSAIAISGSSGGDLGQNYSATGKEGFVLVLGQLFKLGVPSVSAAVALNSLALVIAAMTVAHVTNTFFGWDAAKFVPFVMGLSPALLVWGTAPLREALILVIISLGLCGVTIARTRMTKGLLVVVVAVTLMLFIRSTIAPVLLVACLAAILVLTSSGWRAIVVLTVAPIAVLAVLNLGTVGGGDFAAAYDAERVESVRATLGTASTGFGTSSLSPVTVAIGLFRTAVGPFPWEWSAFPLGALDSPWWIAATASAFFTIRKVDSRSSAALLVLAGALALSVAVTVTNFGLLLRLRTMVLIPMTPLLAVVLSNLSNRLGTREKAVNPVDA